MKIKTYKEMEEIMRDVRRKGGKERRIEGGREGENKRREDEKKGY